MIRHGAAQGKHRARRAWLVAHPDACLDVPGIHDDVTDAGRVALDALRTHFLTLGLFGATGQVVQRETLRRLVSELRGEHVGVGRPW